MCMFAYAWWLLVSLSHQLPGKCASFQSSADFREGQPGISSYHKIHLNSQWYSNFQGSLSLLCWTGLDTWIRGGREVHPHLYMASRRESTVNEVTLPAQCRNGCLDDKPWADMADFSLSPYLESHVMELFLQMKKKKLEDNYFTI